MTETEGVIQYRLDFHPGELPPDIMLDGLFRWYSACRLHQLIGQDTNRYDGFAYGNISIRSGTGFVISGTQTGGLPQLSRQNLALVSDFDVTRNWLRASGHLRPSSEAMTHGQIYRALPTANAVIHVHSPLLWRHAASLGFAITAPEIGYGTPAMANAVAALLTTSDTANPGIFAMGGHEDGAVAYGPNIDATGELLLAELKKAHAIEDEGGQ